MIIDVRKLEEKLMDATTDFVNGLGLDKSLPPILWSYRDHYRVGSFSRAIDGFSGDWETAERDAIAWADALGLTPDEDTSIGTTKWSGLSGRLFSREVWVQVLYISDRDAFEGQRPKHKAAVEESS